MYQNDLTLLDRVCGSRLSWLFLKGKVAIPTQAHSSSMVKTSLAFKCFVHKLETECKMWAGGLHFPLFWHCVNNYLW